MQSDIQLENEKGVNAKFTNCVEKKNWALTQNALGVEVGGRGGGIPLKNMQLSIERENKMP